MRWPCQRGGACWTAVATPREADARCRLLITASRDTSAIVCLYRQLASIEAKERSYKADGRLNYREEAQLKRDLDSLAQNVQVQLRDEDRSYSYNNPYGR